MQRPYGEDTRPSPRFSPSASSTMARRLASQAREPLVPYPAPGTASPLPARRPAPGAGRREWDWEEWAERSERVGLRLARNLERMTWVAVGALAGTAVAAFPAFFMDFATYPFVFAQPLGAALGAVCGAVVSAANRDGGPGRQP